MDKNDKRLPSIINDACEETGTSKEGILHLLNYYIDKCGWTPDSAAEYVLELFENGTIAQIKALGKSDD